MANQQWKTDSSYDGDLSGVPDEFPQLENSVYELTFVGAEPAPTKEGKPAIELELKAIHNLVTDEEAKGRVRFQRVMIAKDDGGFALKQLCNATGLTPPASSGREDAQAFCEALLELPKVFAHVVLRKNKQTGDSYPGVRKYLSEDAAHEMVANFET
jgi:hypothetical protein